MTHPRSSRCSTRKLSFASGDSRCAAWLTVPDDDRHGAGPYPAVLLIHGFGATHEMALPRYEAAFADAGLAVTSFDFRCIGASGGEPRQVFSVSDMLADAVAALEWSRALPEVDPARVALWGTSFGASHAMTVAAKRPEVAAVILNCPMIDCLDAAFQMPLRHLLRLTPAILSDKLRQVLGLGRTFVPLVADAGDYGMIAAPGARAGWYSIQPPGLKWDNRVNAGFALAMLGYRAVRRAPDIQCPMLVSVCERENLMNPAVSVRAAERAPKGRAIRYDADHFEVYHPPLCDRIISDQIAFLAEALGGLPGAAPSAR